MKPDKECQEFKERFREYRRQTGKANRLNSLEKSIIFISIILFSFIISVWGYTKRNQEISTKGEHQIVRENNFSTIEELAKDPDYRVRSSIGSNENTPPYILELLSKDSHPQVRQSVLRNENVSISIIEKLAEDIDESVRASVASKGKTPEYILEKLSKDTSDEVRLAVAYNSRTPSNALKLLSKDQNYTIRRFVANHKNIYP